MEHREMQTSFWALRLTYGLIPIAAGLDKFTNLLTEWTQYLSPFAVRHLPVSPELFMRAVGIVEVAVGVLVLTSATTRLGAWLACGWLAAIALQLLASGMFLDVAARDVALSAGAFALAELATARARQLRSLYPERSIASAPPTATTATAASTPSPARG